MIDWYEMQKQVEEVYRIPQGSLFARTREVPYPEARYMLYYFCRYFLRMSLRQISLIRQDHHSTIIYGTKHIAVWIELYPEVYDKFKTLFDWFEKMNERKE